MSASSKTAQFWTQSAILQRLNEKNITPLAGFAAQQARVPTKAGAEGVNLPPGSHTENGAAPVAEEISRSS